MHVHSSDSSPLFPCLTTVNVQPLAAFERALLEQSEAIEAWFAAQWQLTPAPITTSVDLRHAGFKLAPVDTNLFPAGFNNLQPGMRSLCVGALKAYLTRHVPGCQRVLILPEGHTRNPFYLQSLCVLRDCLQTAGYEVRIGHMDVSNTDITELTTDTGQTLRIDPLIRQRNYLKLADFEPCILLLNHDLSAGIPDILIGLDQPIYPTSQLGWSTRRKSSHFDIFSTVTREFSELTGIDPWLITPISHAVDGIDFMQKTGLDALAAQVESVLARIQAQYDQQGIHEQPFVIVKADNGTYGMSVMTVEHAEQLLQLNRKQRTHMSARKGSQKVTQILVQEGVYSVERIETQAVAEPVIYLIDGYVVGGFYRVHHDRGQNQSLNTPGMYFSPMAFQEPALEPYTMHRSSTPNQRFYVYGVIARLAALAAAREVLLSEETS
jgi:glutamate--cysteine ligase